jgi:hypothetical protein
MVAFNSSRRKNTTRPSAATSPLGVLAASGGPPLDSVFHAGASHRTANDVEIRKEPNGSIRRVRIGRWRVLTAGENRRLAEVRQLGCRRVAIRIERFADGGDRPSSEIWQLYDLDGRLEAALQTTPDGKFAMLTNYRTREACRLVAGASGEMRTVETWKI